MAAGALAIWSAEGKIDKKNVMAPLPGKQNFHKGSHKISVYAC